MNTKQAIDITSTLNHKGYRSRYDAIDTAKEMATREVQNMKQEHKEAELTETSDGFNITHVDTLNGKMLQIALTVIPIDIQVATNQLN